MVDWNDIETVLLDMDGTLLDLHFDNFFWLEHLPRRYAEIFDRQQEEARLELLERFRVFLGQVLYFHRHGFIDSVAIGGEGGPHPLQFWRWNG